MDKIKKSLRESFRKKKEAAIPEASKPHIWHSDESDVRDGTCSFEVKYLGCVEVYESRGMPVCEEALKVLRGSRRRPVRGILYVSGDGLRVVEDETKGLIVDQTIEKVSFCAPDRNHERGFSYICRDGTTRRWMCHGFIAVKDTGERLSHAVGCAFAACLERKQKRDSECNVTMTFDRDTSTFTRMGSFRQLTVTERLSCDPQECKTNTFEPIPVKKVENPHAIARPHATPQLLQRQGSFRVFNHLNESSPFKRQLSLRITDLPSNIERTRSLSLDAGGGSAPQKCLNGNSINNNNNNITISVAPIPEIPMLDESSNLATDVSTKPDVVSAMCQQVSAGLSLLSSNFPDDVVSHSQAAADYTSSTKTFDRNVTKDTVVSPSLPTSLFSEPTRTPSPLEADKVPPELPARGFSGTSAAMEMNSKAEEWLAQINSGNTLSSPRHYPHLSQLRSSSLDSHPSAESNFSRRLTSSNATSPLRNDGHGDAAAAAASSLLLSSSRSPEKGTFARRTPASVDPFDAEWANVPSHTSSSSQNPNNPFLQSNVTKTFQIHM